MFSSSNASADFGAAPSLRIQSGTPWPTPGSNRPGWRRARKANSMASSAGLRSGTGQMPMPTLIRSVSARAAVADDTPPAQPRSSTTQNSSAPAVSQYRTAWRSCSGGRSRSNITPRLRGRGSAADGVGSIALP